MTLNVTMLNWKWNETVFTCMLMSCGGCVSNGEELMITTERNIPFVPETVFSLQGWKCANVKLGPLWWVFAFSFSNQCNAVSGTFAFTIGTIPFRSYDGTESTVFTIIPLPVDNRIAHRCFCARWIIIELSLLFISIWSYMDFYVLYYLWLH